MWLVLVLISSGLVILIFLLWVSLLRKVVASRTRQLSDSVKEIEHKKEELLAANEEISAQAEELERLNKELETIFEDLRTTVQRFNQSIDLFGQIATTTDDEEFFLKFLLLVRFIVPNCSAVYVHEDICYGRIKDNGMEFITLRRIQRGGTLPTGRFQGIPKEIEITFRNKVYETICLASENNNHLVLFNHREVPLEEEIVELVRTTLNITKVFLKMKDYEEHERSFFRKISDVLLTVLNYHEPYTAVHSTRTSEYASKIAQRILLSNESVQKVYWAGLIHDIGKIAIPREILCKPSKLSPEEYEMVKVHPVVAAELLAKAGLDELAKIVRHHHERFDGNGYPDGLRAEQIPIESRIIAVVDAYDAMTSDRPYRKRLSDQQAIEELKKNAGSQFDPLVANTFIDILKESQKE
ncbi:MAG: HD domain-containing phosphohydrolase [Pseudothermotoga sp.]